MHHNTIGRASDSRLGKKKWSVRLLVGNGTESIQFRRILNVLNCNMLVFSSFHAYLVSIHLTLKMKRSFVAENQLSSKTIFLKLLLSFRPELQTADFGVVGYSLQ